MGKKIRLFKRRDGTKVRDRRCGRLERFDSRSRNFAISDLFKKDQHARPVRYPLPLNLDQGSEGACTGFAVTHAWACAMRKKGEDISPATESLARMWYYRAQQLDPWPGEDYEGSSVLAAVQAAQETGHVADYRWGFSLRDLELGLQEGPAVAGLRWHEGSASPTEDGQCRLTGDVRGGHAIVIMGVEPKWRRFLIKNSWGEKWGRFGDCWMAYRHMEELLGMAGEIVFPRFVMPKAA